VRTGKLRFLFSFLILFVGVSLVRLENAAAQTTTNQQAEPCAAHRVSSQLTRITPEGEIKLDNGMLIVLADIGDLAPQGRDWLNSLHGQAVDVATASLKTDRWGRVIGQLFLHQNERRLDMAWALVDAGYAIVNVGEQGFLCDKSLLQDEVAARREKRGLWQDANHQPIFAGHKSLLLQARGRLILSEGRIISVRERGERIYINFSKRWSAGLTVIVTKKIWRMMQDRGSNAASLVGRKVRVRGMVDEQSGPIMMLTAPDMFELVQEEGSLAAR
jgi:hypothetical protein